MVSNRDIGIALVVVYLFLFLIFYYAKKTGQVVNMDNNIEVYDDDGLLEYMNAIMDKDLFPNCLECSDDYAMLKKRTHIFHKSGCDHGRSMTWDEAKAKLLKRVERYRLYLSNLKAGVKCGCGNAATGVRWVAYHDINTVLSTDPSCSDCGLEPESNGRRSGYIHGDTTMIPLNVEIYLNKEGKW